MDHRLIHARTAGLAYLAIGITGMLGFLVVRPRLFSPGDPAATLANLVESPTLAGWGIALELGTVLSQAVLAVAFYRLFRPVNASAAWALASFGMVNAVAILGSAAMRMGALEVATGAAPVADPAGSAHLLFVLSESFWAGGNLFFGLWLVPMGWLVLESGWMPRPLGWVLAVGGVGYVLAGFVPVLAPAAPGLVAEVLVVPATVGELWIIAYLLVRGVRREPDTVRERRAEVRA